MELLVFLTQVFVISLSGALSPGPVTAAAIAMGSRRRFAGLGLALGHIIIELPVMLVVTVGAAAILRSQIARTAISLVGGVMLVLMAVKMLANLRSVGTDGDKLSKGGPIVTGLLLSAGNPYFPLWWATVGLTLATGARQLGLVAFVLFMLVHWFCDAVWLVGLSLASFHGSLLFGRRGQRVLCAIAGMALFMFGLIFLYNSVKVLLG